MPDQDKPETRADLQRRLDELLQLKRDLYVKAYGQAPPDPHARSTLAPPAPTRSEQLEAAARLRGVEAQIAKVKARLWRAELRELTDEDLVRRVRLYREALEAGWGIVGFEFTTGGDIRSWNEAPHGVRPAEYFAGLREELDRRKHQRRDEIHGLSDVDLDRRIEQTPAPVRFNGSGSELAYDYWLALRQEKERREQRAEPAPSAPQVDQKAVAPAQPPPWQPRKGRPRRADRLAPIIRRGDALEKFKEDHPEVNWDDIYADHDRWQAGPRTLQRERGIADRVHQYESELGKSFSQLTAEEHQHLTEIIAREFPSGKKR